MKNCWRLPGYPLESEDHIGQDNFSEGPAVGQQSPPVTLGEFQDLSGRFVKRKAP